MAKSKGEDKKTYSIQVMHSARDLAIFNRVHEYRKRQTDNPELKPPDTYRWLLRDKARALGLLGVDEEDLGGDDAPPLSSSPTPPPHSPAAQTTRSPKARTDPPPSAPDSTPTGQHYQRGTPPASSKKRGG